MAGGKPQYTREERKIDWMTPQKTRLIGISLGLIICGSVTFSGIYSSRVEITGERSIKKQKEFYVEREAHYKKVNHHWDSLINGKDKLNFYLENNLEDQIRFNSPSFEEKERIFREAEKK